MGLKVNLFYCMVFVFFFLENASIFKCLKMELVVILIMNALIGYLGSNKETEISVTETDERNFNFMSFEI